MNRDPWRAAHALRWQRGVGFLLCVLFLPARVDAYFFNVAQGQGLPYEQFEESEIEYVTSCVARGGTPVIMDWNGDGWWDIYLVRFNMTDILFLNNEGIFTRRDDPLGLGVTGGNAPVWADLDNDGDKDLFVGSVEDTRHYLYINEGGGVFSEQAELRGAALHSGIEHLTTGVAVGDINRDGYLDIFIGEWGVRGDATTIGQHYALLLNQGAANPGHFTNVAASAGIVYGPNAVNIYAPMIADFDQDGWPDLAVVSDYGETRLYWNNGDGTFLDTSAASNINNGENGMGTSIADLNGDGLLDWFVTGIGFPDDTINVGNQLYLNQGGRTFRNGAVEAGVDIGGWGWGTEMFDYDNDGDLDIVYTNGIMDPNIFVSGDGRSEFGPMILWRNDGTGAFENVSDLEGVNHVADGAGLVTFDYDNDGDQDILIIHQYSDPVLYRNGSAPAENRWLRVSLEGTDSNRDAIGTYIAVIPVLGGPRWVSEYNPTNTYLAQLPPYVHFGLGAGVESVARVEIRWPSGREQVLEGVTTNQLLHIVEDDTIPIGAKPPQFTREPSRQILRPGEDLWLEAVAVGDPAPVIRWFHNGEPLGVEGPILFIAGVTREDAGKYYATATNSAGTVYTQHARISVRELYLDKSVARQWMEELLDAIRQDYPAPTVHSRNLFSTSVAMWDAWAAYDASGVSVPYLSAETPPLPGTAEEVAAARREAISYAAYRVLRTRFRLSPSAETSQGAFRDRMELLGYDPEVRTVSGDSPAAVGNRIAARVLAHGWSDGANETAGYADQTGYVPVNDPLIFAEPGTEYPAPTVHDPNQWQPLAFDHLVLQNGLVIGEAIQEFLGPNWGWVRPFALTRADPNDVYDDPGPPPYLGDPQSGAAFKEAALELIEFGSWLDPSDGVIIDVSPGARHNNTLGTSDGTGYPVNPVTGDPYPANEVLRADYGRILAEFWADGPDSETPPGHWNSVANYVSDHALFEKRFEGTGPELDALEWDVKLYFALNAAVSDAAIACWDAKRKYNYVRPITMIRYMAEQGQSSDPGLPSYDPLGLPLRPGLVELITEASSAPGERHAHLSEYVGEVALYTWRGIPENPNNEYGGVGWIRALEWMPYQRDTFVSPPFGAYTSGHSTFSRAAAEVLTLITGSAYFPGGLSTFTAKKDEFLEFERGPEEDIVLTWATYYDAADEAGISRLYGGIHVRADDFGGRIMGATVGQDAYTKARTYFEGTATPLAWTPAYDRWVAAMVADPAQPNDPGAFYPASNERLARFFFGPDYRESQELRMASGMSNTHRNVQVSVWLEYNLSGQEVIIETSTDFINWSPMPGNAYIDERPAGNGLVEVILQDPQPIDTIDRRFYRVRVQNRE